MSHCHPVKSIRSNLSVLMLTLQSVQDSLLCWRFVIGSWWAAAHIPWSDIILLVHAIALILFPIYILMLALQFTRLSVIHVVWKGTCQCSLLISILYFRCYYNLFSHIGIAFCGFQSFRLHCHILLHQHTDMQCLSFHLLACFFCITHLCDMFMCDRFIFACFSYVSSELLSIWLTLPLKCAVGWTDQRAFFGRYKWRSKHWCNSMWTAASTIISEHLKYRGACNRRNIHHCSAIHFRTGRIVTDNLMS